MSVELKSNDFVALADIALHNPDLRQAVGAGTRGGYQKRAETMFAHSRGTRRAHAAAGGRSQTPAPCATCPICWSAPSAT